MTTTTNEKKAVEAVIKEWLDALNKNDAKRVRATWDSTYPHLIYIAEENNDAIHGWAGVEGYYGGLERDVSRADWKIDNLKIDVLGDVAWVYLTFVVEAHIIPFNRTMVFPGRNTFILRKVKGQWKFIHYHESLSRDRSRATWDWFFQKK
jgi:ketosteroid isomerase-like protein